MDYTGPCVEKLYQFDKVKLARRPIEYIMRNVVAGDSITYNGVVYHVMTGPCDRLTVRVTYYDYTTKGVVCGGPGPTTRRTNIEIICGDLPIKTKPGPTVTLEGEVTNEDKVKPGKGGDGISTQGTTSEEQSSLKGEGINTGKPPSASDSSQIRRVIIAEPLTLYAPDKVYGSDGTEFRKGEVTRGVLYAGTLGEWEDYKRSQFLEGNLVSRDPIKDSVYAGQRDITPWTFEDTRWGLYSGVYMSESYYSERDMLGSEDKEGGKPETVEVPDTTVVDNGLFQPSSPVKPPLVHGLDPL